MRQLKKWLTPPVFKDETRTEQAYLLHIIVWVLICIPFPFIAYTLLKTPEHIGRTMVQAIFGETANLVILILLHRGYVKTAAWIQITSFWIFFTATAFTGGGVQSEAYLLGYGLVIAIAGMLQGGASALVVTMLSLIAGIVMVNVLPHGELRPGFESTPLTTWIVSLMLFPLGAVLQQLASRTIRNSLARARASEEKHALVSRVSSDYKFSTELTPDGDMHLTWVSGAFEAMTGYTFEEYLAHGGWRAHIHPDDLEQDTQAMVTLMTNQQVVHELRVYDKQKVLSWVRVYAHPVWDEKRNTLAGIVGAVQDITERKRAEEREARRRSILEKVVVMGQQVTEVKDFRTTLMRIWQGVREGLEFDRVGIYLYDPEDNSMNGTFGTNRQGEIADESNSHILLNSDTIEAEAFRIVLHDGFYITHTYATEHHIPKSHIMEGVNDFSAVAAWAGDKPVAVICVDNVLSGRPIADEQLEALRLFAGYAGLAIENARLNDTLQDELAQRQTLIDELETKNAELERFTYTVSHDLKSPLVTITGFLGLLEQDLSTGQAERVSGTIHRITNAAYKMQALLNDLLELSRIGRLINPPEEVPFDQIVNEAVDRVRGILDEAKAIVEIQRDLPVVVGDRIRLVEVVQNLIENAAKYSAPTARTRIEIGAELSHENPVFFVRDNGIGIAPEYHEKIFGLFNKLDARTEGTGIGLTLVKRIIEVHGGRIWVESSPGHGTTFYFTLSNRQMKE